MLSRFVASAAARLRGKVHVGTDALGNAYYSRPHPRIAGKEIREVLPAAGGSDPQSYDPSALPIEWAAWLNGREIAPMQAAVAAHEQVQARQEARRQAALAPPAAEVPAAPENEVLGRPGTGVFEPPPTKAFQPSAWTPGGGSTSCRRKCTRSRPKAEQTLSPEGCISTAAGPKADPKRSPTTLGRRQ